MINTGSRRTVHSDVVTPSAVIEGLEGHPRTSVASEIHAKPVSLLSHPAKLVLFVFLLPSLRKTHTHH